MTIVARGVVVLYNGSMLEGTPFESIQDVRIPLNWH